MWLVCKRTNKEYISTFQTHTYPHTKWHFMLWFDCMIYIFVVSQQPRSHRATSGGTQSCVSSIFCPVKCHFYPSFYKFWPQQIWTSILSHAKHLITLEPGIDVGQGINGCPENLSKRIIVGPEKCGRTNTTYNLKLSIAHGKNSKFNKWRDFQKTIGPGKKS